MSHGDDTHSKQLIGQVDSLLTTFGRGELVTLAAHPPSFFFLRRQLTVNQCTLHSKYGVTQRTCLKHYM